MQHKCTVPHLPCPRVTTNCVIPPHADSHVPMHPCRCDRGRPSGACLAAVRQACTGPGGHHSRIHHCKRTQGATGTAVVTLGRDSGPCWPSGEGQGSGCCQAVPRRAVAAVAASTAGQQLQQDPLAATVVCVDCAHLMAPDGSCWCTKHQGVRNQG